MLKIDVLQGKGNCDDNTSDPTEGYWQVSSLRGHLNCSIVWVAKYDKSIKAHLVGSRETCLHYIQTQMSKLPRVSYRVKSDLTDVQGCQFEGAVFTIPSWNLSNFLQRAIEENCIDELPDGTFDLDPEQKRIVSSYPPLLLESRSGSGKTNVLLQHALSLSQELTGITAELPLVFITVSSLLKSQLEKNVYRS